MKSRHKVRIALVSTAVCLLAILSYFFLSSSNRSIQEAVEKIGQSDEYQGDAVVIKSFRQTVAEGARTIYDLWAQTATLKIETKEYSLQGVLPASTYFDKKGHRISFSADEGIYDPRSDNVILRKNVMAMLSTGLTLKCDEVYFSRSEMIASSEWPVVVSGEGIRFQAKGFSVDLLSHEVLFPSLVYIESESSPVEVMQLLGTANCRPSTANLEEGFLLQANKMLVRIGEKTAELTGDVAFRLGQNEFFADRASFGWGEKLQEIEWGELDGTIVVKTPDGVVGCSKAEYRGGRLVLEGRPQIVHDFARLGNAGTERSADRAHAGPCPTLWSSFSSLGRGRGQAALFGTREQFDLLQAAAHYLGCSTLSADRIVGEESFDEVLATGSVILSLCGLGGMSTSAPGTNSTIRAESLDIDVDASSAHFSGGVLLIQGQNAISASTLTVRMKNPGKADFQVGALDFRGTVLSRVWAPDVFEGHTGEAGPRLVQLSAESLSVDATGGEVRCSGDVSFRSRDQSLDCQELQMSLLEGMSGIRQLVATDRVVLESQGRIATGGKLVFDGLRNVAELTRQPKVWYGENVILGRKVSYNIKTGIFSVFDDVRGEFYSEKELRVADNRGGAQASKIRGHSLEEQASLSLSESIRRPGKVEFSADKLDYNEKTMEGTYAGEVVIRKGEAVFSADSVRMVGDVGSGSIQTLEAQGNVRVQDGTRVLRAEQATYYDDEQKVVLLGSPKVFEFGKMITRGAVVTLYLGRKEYEIEGEDEAKIKTTLFLPGK